MLCAPLSSQSYFLSLKPPTHGVILSMFSITLSVLICLPCAHAVTHIWKTFGALWQDAPLARADQNGLPLGSGPLHFHLCGVGTAICMFGYYPFLLKENNPFSTSPYTPGIQDRLPFLLYLQLCACISGSYLDLLSLSR